MSTSEPFLWAVEDEGQRAETLRGLNELVPLTMSLSTPYGDFDLVRSEDDASRFYWKGGHLISSRADGPFTTVEVDGRTFEVEHISIAGRDGHVYATLANADPGSAPPPRDAVTEFRRALDDAWAAADSRGFITLCMQAAECVDSVEDTTECAAELAEITASTMPDGPVRDAAFMLASSWTGDAQGLLRAAGGIAADATRQTSG